MMYQLVLLTTRAGLFAFTQISELTRAVNRVSSEVVSPVMVDPASKLKSVK